MKQVGAILDKNNDCRFTVFAPLKTKVQLHLVDPVDQVIDMVKDDEGYHSVLVNGLNAGARYFFALHDGEEFPDPASFYQPEGVHGPSAVVDHHGYTWNDDEWTPPDFSTLIFYELHVGTFTDEGTFDAIIPRLDALRSTGINALEIMPVNQFPGQRNWGYDGVYPFAVQDSYGGPDALKRLVDACHSKGIAVFLDVVYNHIGPEGNYFGQYGPYFTDTYKTPWGNAINFDGEWSDGVRDLFAANGLYWLEQYHIDGLRCDAIHMVYDNGAVHFWEYFNRNVKQLEQRIGRSFYMVAESDLNSPRVVRSQEAGGYGFEAQWLDDFHHALYTMLDEKGKTRYEDYGTPEQLAKAYTDGFVLSGEWVKYRKKKFGVSSAGISGQHFIVFNQNHDQVGNRVKGERLSMLVDFERLKLAAAAVLLSPYVPMLFMGEEYGELSPFYYFVAHSDEELISAVRKGRKEEFAGFGFDVDPPDPQSIETFNDCKLKWQSRDAGLHKVLLDWHTTLIAFRRAHAALMNLDKRDLTVEITGGNAMIMHRRDGNNQEHIICCFNFSEFDVVHELAEQDLQLRKLLFSKERRFMEDGRGADFHIPEDFIGRTVILPPISVSVYQVV